ncbi:Serine phosphatase RsbU [Candidatus Terasakiella magnetica]|nr:Serine phosphatase RsbU [Candidatus Terasakiella magnetica]
MSPPFPNPDFAASHALVVEDNTVNQVLVTQFLSTMGVGRVTCAGDGIEGLEKVAQDPPDIIILDIMMPRMNGMEFLQHLRKTPAGAEIPVLVTTALGDFDTRAEAFDFGASDYVVKPIDRREFVSRVSVHLRNQLLIRRLRQYQEEFRRDLDIAQAMQVGLLPTPQELAALEKTYGITIGSVFRSSSVLGGDLWGIIPVDAQRFGIMLVDFSGHGIAAAINTFRLHLLLGKPGETFGDPAMVLDHLNRAMLSTLARGQFATMVCAVIDVVRHTLTLSSAGGTAPALRLPDGETRLLPTNSFPLGLVPEARYLNADYAFPPGSSLLLYSDGLSEASDRAGNLLGEEKARQMAAASGDLATEFQSLLDEGCILEDDLSAVWIVR